MRWPIRNQILLTFGAILLVAVGVIATTSSWLAFQQADRTTLERLRNVAGTLETSSFPFTANVLERMHGLSGAHFVARRSDNDISAATVPVDTAHLEELVTAPAIASLTTLAGSDEIVLGNMRYLATKVQRLPAVRGGELYVLYPYDQWRSAQWNAARPPLAIGGATLAVMALAAVLFAHRLSKRLQGMQQLFQKIAAGEFGHAALDGPEDEIADLVQSANRLSDQLQEMLATLQQTEQSRILAQLAAGLAHQLRNDITGARMAVQLHARRCDSQRIEESLDVALRQLNLTQEHVNAFLAFGRKDMSSRSAPEALSAIVDDVSDLLQPVAEHAHTQLTVASDLPEGTAVGNAADVRTALINLVMNAIEASGSGGVVNVAARRQPDEENPKARAVLTVSDNGPGPESSIAATILEPFVTSKPEGAGLGLALSRQTAVEAGGSLRWYREEGRTVFEMLLPIVEIAAEGSDQLPRPARLCRAQTE